MTPRTIFDTRHYPSLSPCSPYTVLSNKSKSCPKYLRRRRCVSVSKKTSVALTPSSLNMYSTLSPISHPFSAKTDVRYPAATAVTYDPTSHWLSCVYNDHSLYVWDVRDVNRVGKVHSALFHAACVWDLEVNRRHGVWFKPALCSVCLLIRLIVPKLTFHHPADLRASGYA